MYITYPHQHPTNPWLAYILRVFSCQCLGCSRFAASSSSNSVSSLTILIRYLTTSAAHNSLAAALLALWPLVEPIAPARVRNGSPLKWADVLYSPSVSTGQPSRRVMRISGGCNDKSRQASRTPYGDGLISEKEHERQAKEEGMVVKHYFWVAQMEWVSSSADSEAHLERYSIVASPSQGSSRDQGACSQWEVASLRSFGAIASCGGSWFFVSFL